MLPDLDGFSVCELLRQHPSTANIPILMLTCLEGTLSRMNGLSVGADGYLIKPVKIADLLRHIHGAVEGRAAGSVRLA